MKSAGNPIITIELTVSEINSIIKGAYELPFKEADPIIKKLISQAQEQLNPTPKPEVEITE